jgi:large subunit ribosomal protein L25
MRVLEIKGEIRKDTGKKHTKKLRKEGFVPCVLYGGEKNIHFTAHHNIFKDLVYTHHVHLVVLNIEEKKYKAIMRKIQFHPVTDFIQHIDFIEVFDDVPTIVDIPVELTGSSIGLKNGGKLRQRRRSLKVKGLVDKIPDSLKIDMTDIDIGDFIKIGDLSFDDLEIMDPKRVMVAGVVSSRVVAKGFYEEVEEEEEVEEGEEVEGAEEGEKAEGKEGGKEAPKEGEKGKEKGKEEGKEAGKVGALPSGKAQAGDGKQSEGAKKD